MSQFNASVEFYMRSPIFAIAPGAHLADAHAELQRVRTSALAVVSAEGALDGVVSLTDLLKLGRRQAGSSPHADVLTFPKKTVGEVMTPSPVVVDKGARVRDAAKLMVERRIHRVFVQDGERAVGVISTKEILLAVWKERVRTPLSEVMSQSLYSVRASDPLSLATERLEKARVTGLVVVDEGHPVGVFTQREAIASADHPRDEPTESVMSSALLSLRAGTPLYRAASQAAALDVRRIVVMEGDRAVGVVGGLDFARVAT